jgi:hypothetical protein
VIQKALSGPLPDDPKPFDDLGESPYQDGRHRLTVAARQAVAAFIDNAADTPILRLDRATTAGMVLAKSTI